ncbi:unnamed protein product, partial [Rotaria sp. Silwood2]
SMVQQQAAWRWRSILSRWPDVSWQMEK